MIIKAPKKNRPTQKKVEKQSAQKLDMSRIVIIPHATLSIDLDRKTATTSIEEDHDNWTTFGELDLYHIHQCVNALRYRYQSQGTVILSPDEISAAAKDKDAGNDFAFTDIILNKENITNIAAIMFSNRNISKSRFIFIL